MDNVVEWLRGIEQQAANLYQRASEHFKQDNDFPLFLQGLAEDEVRHRRVMDRAGEYLMKREDPIPSEFVLDSVTKQRLEKPLLSLRDALSSGRITKEDMLDGIVKTEFSEWNDFFLYVVNTLKNHDMEFQQATSGIQHHRNKLESFMESLEDGERRLEEIRGLPSVWETAILVVEDSEPMAYLMKAIFSKEAAVETVENGAEGLSRVNERYFDAIISDLNMPVMNGIEFFTKMSEKEPDAGERFLFYTGNLTPQNVEFFKRNRLRFMEKPASVDSIRKAVHEILDRSP